MTSPKFLTLLALLLCAKFSFAQKIELINSGEIIKKGIALTDSGQLKESYSLLNKVSRSDTNYVWAVYEKALTLEADSQFAKAADLCREALALKEGRQYEPDIYNTYGNIQMDMHNYDDALKTFDQAIAKYPSYSLLPFNKGVVFLATKRYADAEECFKKALLINPYMYSAHYQLGLAAFSQGKIIPAYVSFMAYLLFNPGGKYAGKSINFLQQISVNGDEVTAARNNRKIYPNANYQSVEDVVSSKMALDKSYKPIIALDDPISRQMQAVVEKLEYSDNDNDFWVQYYLPYFKKTYADGKFELLIFHMFSKVNIPAIQNYVKKNQKSLDAFAEDAGTFFNRLRATRELNYKRRDTVSRNYFFEEGRLIGRGKASANGKELVGPWEGFYFAGSRKSTGNYNTAGQRNGRWLWYYDNGALKSKENYVNGKLEGMQEYYFDNGNKSADENYLAGQLNGISTGYYYGGNIKGKYTYKADKKNGEERKYYSTGALFSVGNYVNDQLTGPFKEYYKSGKLKDEATYVNGKIEGPYRLYDENGKIKTEGQYLKGSAEGEFKYYYPNGTLKQKTVFLADDEHGAQEEYYDSGQKSTTYNSVKGKLDGEMIEYYRDGKVLDKRTYVNGVITSAHYFDPAGREVSSLKKNSDNTSSLLIYSYRGYKLEHLNYDAAGKVSGGDTIYYPTGKIKQINVYKDGEPNGTSIEFYQNGKKKSESTQVNGKADGYYTGYHMNGTVSSEGWMKDDESEGEWAFYNEKGKLTTRNNYIGGELDGIKEEFSPDGNKTTEHKYYRGWLKELVQYDNAGKVIALDSFPKCYGKYRLLYPNGKLMSETIYNNGEFDGVYKSYYFDGSPEYVYYYKKGAMDSTLTSYYYGVVKSTEGRYLNGNKTGVWKSYDEDGKLSSTLTYADDQLNGEKAYYFPNGTKDFVANYKNGELVGIAQKYDPQGALAYQVNYDDGAATAYAYNGADGKLVPDLAIDAANGVLKSFFANGKPSRECAYAGGTKNGRDVVYYANGKIRSEDFEEFGISQGASKQYYENGSLKAEYNYVNDDIDGLSREYYENGKLKSETPYQNGVIHGPVKYYNETGKLTKTHLYNYGTLTAVTNEK